MAAAAILKTVKLQYLHDWWTNFDNIWHYISALQTLWAKNFTLLKIHMGPIAIWKIEKSWYLKKLAPISADFYLADA